MKQIGTSAEALSFQYFNGANMTIAGAGFAKSAGKLSLFGIAGTGYDFASQKHNAVGVINSEYRYGKNVSVSMTGMGVFNDEAALKFALSPCKLRFQANKNTGLYFEPRGAVKINGNKKDFVTEAIAGTSVKINKNLSGSLELQCYDMLNLNKDNLSINAGLSYQF